MMPEGDSAGEAPCPACGKPASAGKIVGKTQTFDRGVRTTFEVVMCTCGKTYRGKKTAEKKVERGGPRTFRGPRRR